MHHVPILGFAVALLSTASAFVLPHGQADGVYKVRRVAGNEVHEAVETVETPYGRRIASAAASSAPKALSKRSDWGRTYCGCGIGLDPGDTDAAVADLKNQLGDGQYLDPNSSYYSIRGNTVAFVCNTDGNALLKAWSDRVTTGLQDVTNACGLYIAGSTGGDFDFSIGYMQNNGGVDFCGNALSSPAGSC